MRAFEPYRMLKKFNHPEDMKTIIEYLENTGKLNVEYRLLEELYYSYSDSVCCSWRCVDECSLKEFAEYLSHCELTNGGYRYIHEYDFDEDDDDEEFDLV